MAVLVSTSGASHFLACLEETSEYSPGFQAWERVDIRTSSPKGTAEIAGLHRVSTRIEMLLRLLPKTLEVDELTVSKYVRKVRTIQERDVNNAPTVSYTRGNDLSETMEGAGGIGGLLARSSGYSSGNFTTHNYYFADGNGNITYMLDNSPESRQLPL